MENYGNRIVQILNHLGQIILVTILWLICCVPVITMAGATSSFYYASIKSIRKGRGYPWQEFFRSFLRTMLQGIIITLLFIIIGAGIFFGREAAGEMQSIAGIYLLLFYDALAVLLLGIFFFCCINLSRFYMKTGKLLRFSLLMSLRHLPELLVVSAVLLFTGYAYVNFNIPLFSMLVIPGIIMYLLTFLIEPILKKYMLPDKNEESGVVNSRTEGDKKAYEDSGGSDTETVSGSRKKDLWYLE